jgi:hypothetical protein
VRPDEAQARWRAWCLLLVPAIIKLEFNTIYNEGIMQRRGILRNACQKEEYEALKQTGHEKGLLTQESIMVYFLASLGIGIVFAFAVMIISSIQ